MSAQRIPAHYENQPNHGQPRERPDFISDTSHSYTIRQIAEHADPGEILEFDGKNQTHYALHIGEGRIMCIDETNKTVSKVHIQVRGLPEVCHDGKIRMRNHEDIALQQFQVSPRPAKQIVELSRYYQDKVVPYEADFRNSEYYCTLWRYGIGFSTQVARKASIHGEDGYAKYKQLAETEQGAFSNKQY